MDRMISNDEMELTVKGGKNEASHLDLAVMCCHLVIFQVNLVFLGVAVLIKFTIETFVHALPVKIEV